MNSESIQAFVDELAKHCLKPTGQAGFGWCMRQRGHAGTCNPAPKTGDSEP